MRVHLPSLTIPETAHLGPLGAKAALEVLYRCALHPTLRTNLYPAAEPAPCFELARIWSALSEATLHLPMSAMPRGVAAPHHFRIASQGAQHLANFFVASAPHVEDGNDPFLESQVSPAEAPSYRNSPPHFSTALLLALAHHAIEIDREASEALFLPVTTPGEILALLSDSTAGLLRHYGRLDEALADSSLYREAGRHLLLLAAFAASPLRAEPSVSPPS
jgi:hypothetical protein